MREGEREREKFSGIHLDVTIIVRDILLRPIESQSIVDVSGAR